MTINVGSPSIAATPAQLQSLSDAISPYNAHPVTGITYNGAGQVTGYTLNGNTYVVTYTTINSQSLRSTLVGGGRTITYAYDGTGKLLNQTFT